MPSLWRWRRPIHRQSSFSRRAQRGTSGPRCYFSAMAQPPPTISAGQVRKVGPNRPTTCFSGTQCKHLLHPVMTGLTSGRIPPLKPRGWRDSSWAAARARGSLREPGSAAHHSPPPTQSPDGTAVTDRWTTVAPMPTAAPSVQLLGSSQRGKLTCNAPQQARPRGRDRFDLKPGKDVQRVQIPVDHRMIADPAPHQQIGAQERWHLGLGQFQVGLAA